MELAETIGLILLVAVVLLIVLIAVRRVVLSRAGAFDISWRRPQSNDRGWSLGQGRYRGTSLRLYRSFSPIPLPGKILDRTRLVLDSVREPVGTEPDLLPADVIIIRCVHGGTPLEIALSRDALTGLQSWVESRPPSSRLTSGDGSGGDL